MQQNKENENKNIELKTTSLERKLKRLVPPNVKKVLLCFLLNSYVGKALKFCNLRWNLFGGKFDYSLVSDKDAKDILGDLGASEIRFSKDLLLQRLLLLGSSVGVTLEFYLIYVRKRNLYA